MRPNCGQRWTGKRSRRNIVVSYNGKFLRYGKPGFARGGHSAERNGIIPRKNCSRFHVRRKNSARRLIAAFAGEISFCEELFIKGNIRCSQSLPVSLESSLRRHIGQWS